MEKEIQICILKSSRREVFVVAAFKDVIDLLISKQGGIN